jgi:hypothetical protein
MIRLMIDATEATIRSMLAVPATQKTSSSNKSVNGVPTQGARATAVATTPKARTTVPPCIR